MVQETAPPHLLQRESSTQSALMEYRASQHSWNRARKAEWERVKRAAGAPGRPELCKTPEHDTEHPRSIVWILQHQWIFSWWVWVNTCCFSRLEEWKGFCARLSYCHWPTKEHFQALCINTGALYSTRIPGKHRGQGETLLSFTALLSPPEMDPLSSLPLVALEVLRSFTGQEASSHRALASRREVLTEIPP